MQKTIILFTTLLILQNIQAQTTATFEDFNLDAESFLNDAGTDGGFENGNIFLFWPASLSLSGGSFFLLSQQSPLSGDQFQHSLYRQSVIDQKWSRIAFLG